MTRPLPPPGARAHPRTGPRRAAVNLGYTCRTYYKKYSANYTSYKVIAPRFDSGGRGSGWACGRYGSCAASSSVMLRNLVLTALMRARSSAGKLANHSESSVRAISAATGSTSGSRWALMAAVRFLRICIVSSIRPAAFFVFSSAPNQNIWKERMEVGKASYLSRVSSPLTVPAKSFTGRCTLLRQKKQARLPARFIFLVSGFWFLTGPRLTSVIKKGCPAGTGQLAYLRLGRAQKASLAPSGGFYAAVCVTIC